MEAQTLYANSRVNITAEGKRNLGEVIGSTEYRDEYVKYLVKHWNNRLTILSTIAETPLQASYSAFVSGFKNKLNYLLRAIQNIRHLLLRIERTIRNTFIPAVTGGHTCNDKERVPISLPTKYDGLAISIFHKTAEIKFMNPSKITSELRALINQQNLQYDIIEDNLKNIQSEMKKFKEEHYKNVIGRLTREMIPKKNVS